MQLEWVNHASFLITQGGVGLICDPWLTGDAFDHGWSLVSETQFTPQDFERVTHIWFSHEHPDHFSPPNLKSIPSELRARITVLYQASLDGRVASFCRRLGFKRVVELAEGEVHELGDQVSIRVYPYIFGDSWATVQVGSLTLLNLNDCVVNTAAKAQAIAERVGSVDVLFTQFSNAQGIGNPADNAKRRAAALEKLARIKVQVNSLNPTHVVPFASFIWFSHEENQCHNDGTNTVHDAFRFIENETAATPICLYPGDEWDCITTIDSDLALARYQTDYERLKMATPRSSASIEFDVLVQHHKTFTQRLAEKNGALVLKGLALTGRLATTTAYLHDLGYCVRFDLKHFERIEFDPEACDIALSSSALDYCFRFEWGGDTLSVNGRFTTPQAGQPARFRRYFSLANLNNKGQTIGHYLPAIRDRAFARVRALPRTLMQRTRIGRKTP